MNFGDTLISLTEHNEDTSPSHPMSEDDVVPRIYQSCFMADMKEKERQKNFSLPSDRKCDSLNDFESDWLSHSLNFGSSEEDFFFQEEPQLSLSALDKKKLFTLF